MRFRKLFIGLFFLSVTVGALKTMWTNSYFQALLVLEKVFIAYYKTRTFDFFFEVIQRFLLNRAILTQICLPWHLAAFW